MSEQLAPDREAFDYLIIGAGIAGASVAYHLAQRGKVAVLEREGQPGYHSTGRSAAMFMETYGTPAIQALTRASRAFYENPPEGFAGHPLLRARGVLYIATHAQQDLLQSTYEALRASAPNVSLIDAQQAQALVPVVRADTLCGAIMEDDATDIDVHELHQGYLRGMRARGGVLRANAEVVRADREDGHWTVSLADGGMIRARVVVNAAGAWADRIAPLFNAAPVGLEPRRRSAFIFAAPQDMDVADWPAVVAIDESFYFKPEAGQLLGSPANADPVQPHDVIAEEYDIALGIHHIENATTLRITRPQRTWAGLRSFVKDGDFVIGYDAAAEDFFWLAAQGGYGIQTAAAASELAAALVLRQAVPAAIAAQGFQAGSVAPGRLR